MGGPDDANVRDADSDKCVLSYWYVFSKVLHQQHSALTVQKKLQSDCVVWTLHVFVLFHVHHQV